MARENHKIPIGNGLFLCSNTPYPDLRDLLCLQLANNFGPLSSAERETLEESIAPALRLLHRNFSMINNQYYCVDGQVQFNPFHSGIYCIFIHFVTRIVFEANDQETNLCDKLFYLNRIMHAVDIFYASGLPNIFFVEHPLGSCMGRANYSDYFLFHQGCTVGGRRNEHPSLGKRIVMFAGAKILGRSRVGDNTVLSANACVSNQDVPGNCIVFGSSPALVFKPLAEIFFDEYFLATPGSGAV